MTYLPPALATSRPESIGVPIPGGTIRLDPVPGTSETTGELVYRGPNVMLGYAEGPADLALGRTVDELRTGDIGRRAADGLYEIVGRRGGFLKIAGLRVDPHGVERLLERRGLTACAVGTDERLVVVIAAPEAPDDLGALIRSVVCLPAHAIHVVTLPELPRLANGKVDRTAVQLAAREHRVEATPPTGDAAVALRELYASALGVPQVGDDDSFASLGGDSLSYVELTLGLEEILGRLPAGWERTSLRDLAAGARPSTDGDGSRRPWLTRWRAVEMSIVLRAIAIVLIVGTHIGMVSAAGGAHVLMAVAGFNFARFRLTATTRTERFASQLRAVARIAVPAMAWVGLVMVLGGDYELRHLLLVNALVQDELWGNLWFIELLVYISLAMAALSIVPALDRVERRWPFGAALAVLGTGLLFRYELLDLGIPYTKPVLWLFAIGWAASRARGSWQRALVLAIAIASVAGYFDSWERNATILVGVALLVGVPSIRVPAMLARVGAVLAAASLYIYLVHWQVWPMFEDWYGVPSLVASVAVGIGLWQLTTRAARRVPELSRRILAWVAEGGTWFGRTSVGRAR